jgi:uncharacterized protein involved in exopolysaccharide biosynthesis
MNDLKDTPHIDEEELNIKEILQVIWKGKTSIILLSLTFFSGSVIYALTATHLWTSSSTLTIVADSNIGSSRSAMSGLAGLAGISLSNSNAGPDRAEVALATIKSRDFLKHLLELSDILPNLMAAESYNKSSGQIKYDSNKFDPQAGWLVDKPSYLEAMKQYNKILDVSINKKTQFLDISITHISPTFAYDLLGLIIKETNTLRRDRDLKEAEITLGYLYQELENTNDVDLRLSINTLIESQMKKKMLARVKTNYLLEPLDLPFIPEERASPVRTKIVLFGSMLGFFIALFLNLFSFYGFGRVNIINSQN